MYFVTSPLVSLIPKFSIIGLIRKESGKRKVKIHNYTHYDAGIDYIFEPAQTDGLCYLTSQGRNIKQGDCILLGDNANPRQYEVTGIDRYSNPSDMSIAVLKPIKM